MVAFTNPLTQKLLEVRAKAAQTRREAFVNSVVMVCRFQLRPVTLDSHNHLLAERNSFATPGVPLRALDIASFIWLHHPRYDSQDLRLKGRVFRQVNRRLYPFGHRFNDGLRKKFPESPLIARLTTFTVAERVAAAAYEIRRLLTEALQDFPKGSEDGEPLPCAHQAYILGTMRRLLSMPFEETSHMPLKRLSQHLREVIHHRSGGKAMQLTEDEAAIWAEDLRRKTEAARSPAAIQAEQDVIMKNAQRRMKGLES